MAEPQEEEAVINDIQAVKVSQCRASLPVVSSSSSRSHFSPSVLMQLITDRHIILPPSGNRSSLGIKPSTTLLSVLHLGGSCTQRVTLLDIWNKPSEPILRLLRCSLETLRLGFDSAGASALLLQLLQLLRGTLRGAKVLLLLWFLTWMLRRSTGWTSPTFVSSSRL